MKVHYGPVEASYSSCGKYLYNSTTLRVSPHPGRVTCLVCRRVARLDTLDQETSQETTQAGKGSPEPTPAHNEVV